jgi:hypothetical protein
VCFIKKDQIRSDDILANFAVKIPGILRIFSITSAGADTLIEKHEFTMTWVKGRVKFERWYPNYDGIKEI